MKLYEIADEMRKLLDTEDESIDVQAELSMLNMAFKEKARNIAGLVKSLEAEREAVSNEARRLGDKGKALENRIEQIKDYLQNEMVRTGQDSIKAGIFRIRMQHSPMGVEIKDVDAIPSVFKEELREWKIDKRGILNHLKETGELVGGVEVRQAKHLRIY